MSRDACLVLRGHPWLAPRSLYFLSSAEMACIIHNVEHCALTYVVVGKSHA